MFLRIALAALLLGPACCAEAQVVVEDEERLEADRPEAWAMNYVAATTLLSAFGESPQLAPWRWRLAADLGHVPRLNDSQRRVGFTGSKEEDLNKSPVFGRLRAAVGLPGGFVAELGYTPPVEIRGTRALDLFAFALGCRVLERDGLVVSARVFGQVGRGRGDITCPRRLAGVEGEGNPFGCRAASDDRITLAYYGADATASWDLRGWRAHAGLGAARTDLEVRVDALTFGVRDRSRLYARSAWPFATLGASRDLDAQWNVGIELLYVPLRVRRDLSGPTKTDPLTSLRLRVAYRFD